MSFITTFSVTQLDFPAAGNPASVRIDWIYGLEVPEIVQIYVRGAGEAQFAGALAEFKINAASPQTSETIALTAGTPVIIGVVPRQSDGLGTLLDRTTPREGQAVYWETYLLEQLFVVQAAPSTTTLLPPTITNTTVHKGRFVVDWTVPNFPSFLEVRFGPKNGGSKSEELHKNRRTHEVRRVSSGTWRFSVRSAFRNRFFGIPISVSYTEWAENEIDIDDSMAWEPWAEGTPNAHVAVEERLVLQVAQDGRPYISHPEAYTYSTPVPIGPSGVTLPGSGIAVVQQTDDQTTALVIDNGGRMAFYWSLEGQPWQGPAFHGNGLAPGAPVALARQLRDLTVAATVDASGAVVVAWTSGKEAWKDPVAITASGFTHPGASVALLRESESVVTLMVVDGNGALCVAHAVDAQPWSHPVAISQNGVFAPETGIALAIQDSGIAVGAVMGPRRSPYITFTNNGSPWSTPTPLAAQTLSTDTGGVGLGGGGIGFLGSAWFDNQGVLLLTHVATGQAWQPTMAPFASGAAPGNRLGMHGATIAFVDPVGRLGIVFFAPPIAHAGVSYA